MMSRDCREEIAGLKRQGAQACAEIEEIEQRRALAPSYEAALAGEERTKELRWNVAHVDAVLPGLEARLAQAMADRRQAALARHRAIGAQVYAQLRAALVEAGQAQALALRAREDAIQEVGEGLVQMHLPAVAFMGLLTPEFLQLYFDQMDRVFAPRPKPKPVAVAPKALPKPPTKPREVISSSPSAPRVARQPYRDTAPGEGETLLQILRSGLELDDGRQCAVGDVVRVSTDKAGLLLRSGAAEPVKESANG
jgi:hypothetical protein